MGEDGEVEYGGLSAFKDNPIHDLNYELKYFFLTMIPRYLDTFSEKELSLWLLPTTEDFKNANIINMHMNYFDPWDPYKNYLIAKNILV